MNDFSSLQTNLKTYLLFFFFDPELIAVEALTTLIPIPTLEA